MMAAAKSLVMHGAVLVVAGALALRTWTKEEELAPKSGETDLWPARIEDDHEVELKLEPLRRLSPGEVERGVSEITRAADSLRRKSEAP